MRSRTPWVVVLLVGALISGACNRGGDSGGAGGGGGDGEATKEVVIGWTPPDITGVFKTATDFFETAAQEANSAGFSVEIVSRSPATHTAFADQLAIIEDFISQQVDVIAISPADTEAVKPAIQQANTAGIPVIMVNLLEPQDDIEVASYIGFDNSEAASVSAYSVLDYYGGPGVLGAGEAVDVAEDEFLDLKWWEGVYEEAEQGQPQARGVIIEGIAGTFFSQARLDGFNEVVEQYPNVEVLAEPIAADWNREKGIKATETFLSRFTPKELDFIWAASNEMGLGAMLTAGRRGVLDSSGGSTPPQESKIAVFTNDVTPESTDAIREGKLIAETHHGFPEWGWFGTEFAVKLACGQKVPKTEDIRPRTVWQGNADQFYPEPDLPAIDWKTIKRDC
jgi:ribose transport system substrate-binding protein